MAPVSLPRLVAPTSQACLLVRTSRVRIVVTLFCGEKPGAMNPPARARLSRPPHWTEASPDCPPGTWVGAEGAAAPAGHAQTAIALSAKARIAVNRPLARPPIGIEA